MSKQANTELVTIVWQVRVDTDSGRIPGYAMRQRSLAVAGHTVMRYCTNRCLAFRAETDGNEDEIYESRVGLPFYGALEPEPMPGRRISYTQRLRRPLLTPTSGGVRTSAQKVRRSRACRSLRACVFRFR